MRLSIPACLALAVVVTAPGSLAQDAPTEYVSFWRGHLRLFAAAGDTRVTILDASTGLPLNPATWSGNYATNPFVLRNAGDSFEGTSNGATLRVHVVSQSALDDGVPKPLVAWTGWLSPSLLHPPAPPLDENAWASYIPDVVQGVPGSVGAELGHQFIGFSSRDMVVFAQKTGPAIQIQVEDLATNSDSDTDDGFLLERTSPYLIHEDAEVEIYRYAGFEDDTIRLTSNVPTSVLVGMLPALSQDWTATPPSYGSGESGRELGTLFYAFGARWLTIMPTEDATTVTVTDLSDGDDTHTTVLAAGDRLNAAYDMYLTDPTGEAGATQRCIPRPAAPLVSLYQPPGGALEDDLVKITASRPVLVQVGPIASNMNEFADVAYSVPTGPTSQIIYAYAQNGAANDFQMFSFHANNSIRITSLTYTQNWGAGYSDFSIPTPTPFEGGNPATADWFWSSGVWGGELLRIESDWPVQVMSGDYDTSNFGAFIPFVAVVSTRPPLADGGPDQTACPGETITLDGSASADTDTVDGGRSEGWTWDLDVAVDSDGNTVPDDDVDAVGPVIARAFAPGLTVVKLTYTDNDGETDEVLIEVLMEDLEPPLLACDEVIRAPAESFGSGTASPMATATDNCSPPPTIVNDRTAAGPDATDLYPCGSTLVTFTATDASGNQSECTTRVIIEPEGSISEIGPTLRVRKLADRSPELDWSRVGPTAPDSLFVVLRSDRPSEDFGPAPSGGPLPEVVWADANSETTTWYYDVRSVLCDGTLSAD